MAAHRQEDPEEEALVRIMRERWIDGGNERCDRCSAQAFVLVRPVHGRGALTLCGHHYGEVEGKLPRDTWIVVDRRPWRPSRQHGTMSA